jgi:chitinase
VDFAANYWVSGGCPKEKLIIGMATYGVSFTLSNAAQNGLGAPKSAPGSGGTSTKSPGFLAYLEICQMAKKPGAVTVFDDEHKAPYTYLGDQWVGYDNVQSLTMKVGYLKQRGFGGWMTWTLDLDDFSGKFCNEGTYPLHKALNKALTGTVPSQPDSTKPQSATQRPVVPTTARIFPTTRRSSGGGNAQVCSDKSDGLHVNPDSCTSYYNCANGFGAALNCPGGTYYNPAGRYCDWPYNLSAERKAACGVS